MSRWYQTVFAAKVQFQSAALAFLTYDDEHHRFAIGNLDVLEPGGANVDGAAAIHHVSYTLATLKDLANNYERLKAAEILPFWCVHHGFTISMYYGDPDGNQIEFQVNCFATADEAVAYMHSEAMARNPIGVEYDAESFVSRLVTGVPEQDFYPLPDGLMSPIRYAQSRRPGKPPVAADRDD
jgi:hypothetical protein